MATYRIDDNASLFLARDLPETAMGFQIVETDILSFDGSTFLVIAAQLAIPFMSYKDLVRELNRLGTSSWETALERAQPVMFKSEPRLAAANLGVRLAASLLDPSIDWTESAKGVYNRQEVFSVEKLTEPRLFFRFSAAPIDTRVLPDGSWSPGTYATTYNDLRMVPSGFAAVGRYALPNPQSARYVFPIITNSSPVYMGTVTPNFGQAGGGVEAMFPNGAKPLPGVPHRIARE